MAAALVVVTRVAPPLERESPQVRILKTTIGNLQMLTPGCRNSLGAHEDSFSTFWGGAHGHNNGVQRLIGEMLCIMVGGSGYMGC